MTRIVIPDDMPPVLAPNAAFRKWSAARNVEIYTSLPATEEDLIRRIGDAEIVICTRASTQFTANVFAHCPHLRLLSIFGTGTDNIDLNSAKAAGVTVTNTPGVSSVSVAEHCLALMLAVARKIPRIDSATRKGKWPHETMVQLQGKTLGVIGLGAIGHRFANLAQAIGMRVITWTMHPSLHDNFEFVPLERIFTESDVISLHLRLSPETRRMIGWEQFRMMKPDAIFLNTARAAIVDEAALLRALRSHTIAGAGLDVFDIEPLPAHHPLTELDNVVLSPHSASVTSEAIEASVRMIIENIHNYLAGVPTNIVIEG